MGGHNTNRRIGWIVPARLISGRAWSCLGRAVYLTIYIIRSPHRGAARKGCGAAGRELHLELEPRREEEGCMREEGEQLGVGSSCSGARVQAQVLAVRPDNNIGWFGLNINRRFDDVHGTTIRPCTSSSSNAALDPQLPSIWLPTSTSEGSGAATAAASPGSTSDSVSCSTFACSTFANMCASMLRVRTIDTMGKGVDDPVPMPWTGYRPLVFRINFLK